MLTSLEICIFARKLVNYMCTNRLKTAFVALSCVCASLFFGSWDSDSQSVIGPIPASPHYDDPSQWFMVNRQGEADLFYIISTETGDHMIGSDTCHFADTYNAGQRGQMRIEMHAVDSFYSGKLNYYSPYYRQVSLQSWSSTETALARLPLAMSDCVRSWDYYIKHLNQGRPFILAGFSQGAHIMLYLLKEMDDDTYSRMVVAYAIGTTITQEMMDECPKLRAAQGAEDTGVTICYNSVKDAESIAMHQGKSVFSINPVNWRTDSTVAKFATEPSPLLPVADQKKDKLSVHLDPATNMLFVSGYTATDYVLPLIGNEGSYHSREIWLYRQQLKENMAQRVASFLKGKK